MRLFLRRYGVRRGTESPSCYLGEFWRGLLENRLYPVCETNVQFTHHLFHTELGPAQRPPCVLAPFKFLEALRPPVKKFRGSGKYYYIQKDTGIGSTICSVAKCVSFCVACSPRIMHQCRLLSVGHPNPSTSSSSHTTSSVGKVWNGTANPIKNKGRTYFLVGLVQNLCCFTHWNWYLSFGAPITLESVIAILYVVGVVSLLIE